MKTAFAPDTAAAWVNAAADLARDNPAAAFFLVAVAVALFAKAAADSVF